MATISSRTTKLPAVPFDSQVFTDYYKTKWQWSSKLNRWVPIGKTDQVADATADQDGLLSAADKTLLDAIPVAGGGFGIITRPQVLISPDNPSGIVQGDITLVSDSMDIECINNIGEVITASGSLSAFDNGNAGLRFRLNGNFLSSLCVELNGAPGARGPKGPKGNPGQDGFNNGPAGDQGPVGADATSTKTFTDVKIVDVDGITDTAVVAMELISSEGSLVYTTAKLAVPDSSTPADKVMASPIFRGIEYPFLVNDTLTQTQRYSRLDEWQITMPDNDIIGTTDVLLLMLNKIPNAGGTVTYSTVKLSDFIGLIVQYYSNILCEWQTTWEQTIKAFIEEKDASARGILANLAQQVSECEFALPIDFCLGVSPGACSSPKVQPVALVSAKQYSGVDGSGNPVYGPYTFMGQVADTSDTALWKIWPDPDRDDNMTWDVNHIWVIPP